MAASLAAAALYAIGGVHAATTFHGDAPLTTTTGQQLGAAIVLAPLLLLFPPQASPPPDVTAAVIALAVLSTAAGLLLFYRLIARIGATASLGVTYLVPLFGAVLGWAVLDEPLTAAVPVGAALVLTAVHLLNASSATRA